MKRNYPLWKAERIRDLNKRKRKEERNENNRPVMLCREI